MPQEALLWKVNALSHLGDFLLYLLRSGTINNMYFGTSIYRVAVPGLHHTGSFQDSKIASKRL